MAYAISALNLNECLSLTSPAGTDNILLISSRLIEYVICQHLFLKVSVESSNVREIVRQKENNLKNGRTKMKKKNYMFAWFLLSYNAME